MNKILSLLVGAILAGSGLVANAAMTTSANDPDDTGGRLDIRYVKFERSSGKVTLTLRTYEKWRCRLLKDDTSSAQGAAEAYADGKAAWLLWSFGTDRYDDAEHTGFFRCKNGRLKFEMNRHDVSYKVRRPNRRTVKVTLPVGRFGLDKQRLRVYAASQLNGHFDGQTFFDEIDHSPHLHPYRS